MGTRPVGRPRQRWREDVMEGFKKPKMKNWKETAKGRRTWRDLAEKAKNPHRVVVPNDDDDDDVRHVTSRWPYNNFLRIYGMIII